MDFSIRTATPAEQMYSYSQSSQIEGQTGCIGHLRADFDSDGNSFYSSWADDNASLKDQAFKDEFDHLINTLRGLEAPDASQTQHEAILRDRAVLTSYCYRHPDSKKPGFYGRELTLRADTQKHAYILRLNPKKGDYNLYCYCYRKDWFDRHLNNAERGIRFIDPNYKELFRIEDGDKIRYFTNSGEPRHLICRYIDDYHFEATSDRGKNLYHICEFAEQYQNQGCHGIIPLRKSLPESCFSTLGTTGELIVITKGEKGYSPTDVYPQNTSPKEGAAALNATNGVTKAQEAAMVAGSMFGWIRLLQTPRTTIPSVSQSKTNGVPTLRNDRKEAQWIPRLSSITVVIFITQISNRIWAVNRAVFALFWWFRTMSEISIPKRLLCRP